MTHDAGSVILDVTPGDHEKFEARHLEGAGHRLVICHGPDHEGRCPLLEEGYCERLDEADGVVFKLDLDRGYHRRILSAYRRTIPGDMPLAVGVYPGQDEKYAELLDGLEVWGHTPTMSQLDDFATRVRSSAARRADRAMGPAT